MITTYALRLGTAALAVSILGVAPAPAVAAPASEPVVQARIGNNLEGATLITNGRHAGQIAVLDGFAVRTVSVNGARTQPQTLFSIKHIAWPAFPSGIAYLSGEKTFAYIDQAYGFPEPPNEEPTLLTYDPATGALLATSTPETGSLFQPLVYLAGPDGGYAIIDPNNSEMAVFAG
ncbi:MAG: hypothetical protein ACRDT4_16865 [Micromonosporaceae bacterium]